MSLAEMIELRSLVDVLYDVQDVRTRTDNRLRQMPKETAKLKANALRKLEDDLTKEIDVLLQDIPIYKVFLSKVRGVGPRISGSIIGQTMIRFEEITEDEYKELKSRYTDDAHIVNASHCDIDAHDANASHNKTDTQNESASHNKNDTHFDVASQRVDDTQNDDASQQKDDAHVFFTLEQFQLAQKTGKGKYLIPTRRGIEDFDTCSEYWAWWGLHVVNGAMPKRKKGEPINWNPELRTLAWKIGKQFVMQGQGYRQIYDQEKDKLTNLRMPIGVCPKYEECKAKLKNVTEPTCKGHIDNMSKRKAVKLFLAHLYECWRGLEGLPTRPPYVLEYLGHTTKNTWQDLPDLQEDQDKE